VLLHLLDTDTVIFVIEGHSPGVEERLAAVPPDRTCVSAVARAELMYGLSRISPSHRLQIGVRAFLKIMRVLAWGADAADVYADIRHKLTGSGQPIGDMDMLIAAHAVALDAVLVTNDTRHFGRIGSPLVLVNWR
jgi:tRNA(fMet)-specific endonuclease VapC